MTRLSISLLGSCQVQRDGLAGVSLAYDKVRALLAYLAIESDRPHRREALADLLWPEQDERAARHSLSQALFSLRQSVGDHDAPHSLLLLTRDTVQLNRESDYWLDVDAFTSLLDEAGERQQARERGGTRSTRLDRTGARLLEQAIELWRGPLLEQMPVTGSVAFDEWLLVTREHLQQQAARALGQLVEYHEWRGDFERACARARQLIELDPWREDTTRRLMRMLATSGQRAAALEEYERCRRVLQAELELEPERETTDLWRQIHDGLLDVAPVRRGRGITGNLPAQPASFIGRERELRELWRLLDDDSCRLVTLVGPGGIGKTQLSIRAASTASDTFAHGASFVSLAGLDTPALLPHAIADALSLTLDGQGNAAEQLVTALREWELLLVLDNFEHLLDGAELLVMLLDRAPDIRVMVTSRERLELRDEWVLEVTGLSLPDGDDLSSIEASSAAQLFMQCARKANASRHLQMEELPAVARLCRVVSGMPLGIELAASWAPMMTYTEIAAEVEASLDFLSARVRDMPERHRSMRAVFDQSWGRLTEVERRAFRRLSVFRGGFRRDAAETVAGATLPMLSALVAKSLVRRGAGGRYEIHELLRQYGEEWLNRNDDETTVVRDRHCDHFTTFLSGREASLKGPEQATALAEIGAELENIRAGWGWAMRCRRAAAAAAMIHPLWLHTEITGRYREMTAMIERAAIIFDSEPADDGSVDKQRVLALGRALSSYGSHFIRLGDNERGSSIVERSIEVLRRLDVPSDLGLAYNFRAMYAQARQEYRQAIADLRESIALFEAGNDAWGMGYSLNDLGMASMQLGDDAQAWRLGHESLSIFRRIGDKRGMAFALHNLGVAAIRLGNHAEARALHQEALAIRQEIGYTWGIAMSLIQLGVVARAAAAYEESAEFLIRALEEATEAQSHPAVLRALVELAALSLIVGEPAHAHDMLSAIVQHPAGDSEIRDRVADLLCEHDLELDAVLVHMPSAQAARAVEEHAHLFRERRLPLTRLSYA